MSNLQNEQARSEHSRIILENALSAVRKGWKVFPCSGKEPHGLLAPKGFHSATSDESKVREWFDREHSLNYGIACAPSGLVVLDVDVRNGGRLAETLAHFGITSEQYEAGFVVESGGAAVAGERGRHIYVSNVAPSDKLKGHIDGLGIDIKANGYVLGPGSLHPETGDCYTVVCEGAPLWPSEGLWERITDNRSLVAKADAAYERQTFTAEDAKRQGRQVTLYKYVSSLRGLGVSLEDAQILAMYKADEIGYGDDPDHRETPEEMAERVWRDYEPNDRTERPAATTAGTTGKAGLVTHSRGFGAFMEEKMEDLDFVIQGLYRGGIGQFIAQQSSYKTTLGLNLLLSLACGKAFEPFTQNGAFNLPMNGGIAKPRNVVFLDFENIPKFVQDDLRTMFEKNAFDEYERAEINRRFYPIISPQIRLNDDPDTDTLACLSDEAVVDLICGDINDYFGEKNTDLILIDTQSEAFNLENENDNGANGAGLVIRALNQMAKRTGAAVLLIHHTGKVGEEANQRKDYGRGASRFATAMRYITRFDQSKDSGGRFVAGEITVENVKAKGPKMYDGEKVYFTHNPETRWMVWGTAPSVVLATQNDAPADDQPEPTDRDAWIDWRIGQTGCSRDAARALWNKRNRS